MLYRCRATADVGRGLVFWNKVVTLLFELLLLLGQLRLVVLLPTHASTLYGCVVFRLSLCLSLGALSRVKRDGV